MFYCADCGEKRGWPTDFFLPQSYGKCEVCNDVRSCLDVPSRKLPIPQFCEPSAQEVSDAIESIKKELP